MAAPALMEELQSIPVLYMKNLALDVYNELRDEDIIELECTPFKFYGKVSPQLLIQKGYSEFTVYLFSHILEGGWIEYHNTVARHEGKEEFHFYFESVPESIRTEKFIHWLQKKDSRTRNKNLLGKLKRVLITECFPDNNFCILTVEDIFATPPGELYKCSGIGKGSILKLKDYLMETGLDWFYFHKFDPDKDFKRIEKRWRHVSPSYF